MSAGKTLMWLISGEKKSYKSKDLMKYSNYSFRIAAINHRGIGPFSQPVLATTEEDGEQTQFLRFTESVKTGALGS